MALTKCILLDCEYFPCIAWYKQYLNNEQTLIEQHEFFVRTSFRNRCYVAGANGRFALTIPLKGGRNQKTIMKDMKVSFDTDWRTLHWKTIESAYRRSPYFEYYEPEIKVFFEEKFETLLEWNLASLNLVNQLILVKKEIVLTKEYQLQNDSEFTDLRNVFMARDEKMKHDLPQYFQTFMDRNGFFYNLSILDLLFCEGKSLLKIL